uniref:CCHC-type domain-containing protein n=1 Tax=Anopheles funestus TaxID=62324 RepID=A0A182RDC5_ANOFN
MAQSELKGSVVCAQRKQEAAALDANQQQQQPEHQQQPKQPKQRVHRVPDALELETTNDTTQEMMHILKEKLGNDRQKVERVRMNFQGNILLELSCKNHNETLEMWRKVSEALEGKAKARPWTPTTRLTCTNIPQGCTNEEIASDLSTALGVTIYADQISTIKSNYGTLVAVTDGVLLKQHVVGFSQCCRFKKVEVKRQCNRCYEFGHIATHCRGKDRSSKCHRCAEAKHSGQCTKERNCLVCKDPEAIGHSFGQRNCRQVGEGVKNRPRHD